MESAPGASTEALLALTGQRTPAGVERSDARAAAETRAGAQFERPRGPLLAADPFGATARKRVTAGAGGREVESVAVAEQKAAAALQPRTESSPVAAARLSKDAELAARLAGLEAVWVVGVVVDGKLCALGVATQLATKGLRGLAVLHVIERDRVVGVVRDDALGR